MQNLKQNSQTEEVNKNYIIVHIKMSNDNNIDRFDKIMSAAT